MAKLNKIFLSVFLVLGLLQPVEARRVFKGKVSIYGKGDGFAYKRMANGQRMNPNHLIAAHKTLPFGTRLRLKTKYGSTVVIIKDRGPYIKGRILDLSPAAANQLGYKNGVFQCTAEILD